MSLLLPCPRCGARPLEEFVHGEILTPPDHLDEAARALDRAYMHDNPEGLVSERWFHLLGCRRWLTLERDTRSDTVIPQAQPAEKTRA